MEPATLITEISGGATAVVGAVGSTVTTLVTNPTFLTLMGLAIGYGIVKFVIGFLPMIKSR